MYKKILLAADGSENSLRAAEEAVKVASLDKQCVIEIVYIVNFTKSRSEVLHLKEKKN